MSTIQNMVEKLSKSITSTRLKHSQKRSNNSNESSNISKVKSKPITPSLRTMNSHLSNEELLARLTKLEAAVSNLMMRRPGHEEYEKLVDVVCDHETRLQSKEQQPQSAVGGSLELSEINDVNW